MDKTPRPKDYVLIDGDTVYDVRCIGGGPGFWAMKRYPRPKPPPRWRAWVRPVFLAARTGAVIWLFQHLAEIYISSMRP